MRYLLLTVELLASLFVTAQLNTVVFWTEKTELNSSDIIYYRADAPLEWKDFKGKPVMNSRAAAITVSGFGYKAEMKNMGNTGQLNVSVYCYFSKPKSWVKEGRTTGYILLHEQHHFDISYIGAKIFMEKVKQTNFTTSNVNILLPRIYNECCDMMNKMQDDYDGQTSNGQNEDRQQAWHALIQDKLLKITN